MGTEFRIVLYADDKAVATRATESAFRRIAELDAILSDYSDTSELTKLSQSSGGPPVPVSNDLWNVLACAREVSTHTDGCFDITVGPAVRLWRRARRDRELPRESNIKESLDRIGFRHVILDDRARSAQLTTPRMILDLGGIAKGYAVTEALRTLRQQGISRAMVVGGGEVGVGDPPPNRNHWSIAINIPGETEVQKDEYLPLKNVHVSTSGDASQFVILGDKRYSHIVDPRTGWALATRRQVTVVAEEGMLADALASGLCVAGIENAPKIMERFPQARCRIHEIGGDHRTWTHNWTFEEKDHAKRAP